MVQVYTIPAFPEDQYYDERIVGQYAGMLLVDWFAGRIVTALLTPDGTDVAIPETSQHRSVVARTAYDIAEAMIEERIRRLQQMRKAGTSP